MRSIHKQVLQKPTGSSLALSLSFRLASFVNSENNYLAGISKHFRVYKVFILDHDDELSRSNKYILVYYSKNENINYCHDISSL